MFDQPEELQRERGISPPLQRKLPKFTKEVTDNLNSSISTKIIEFVVTNLPIKKTAGTDGSTGEFYQMLKEEIIQSTHTLPENRTQMKKSLNKMLAD